MLLRVCLSLSLFLVSLAAGWWLHRRAVLTEARASRLVRLVVKGLSPLVLCLSFWRMDLRSLQVWLLPLLGALISSSTLVPAWYYAKSARLSRPQTGSFLTCAYFSNVGYLGAFLAFALFGEGAYALCVLYFLLFTPAFYTLGFTLASRFGRAQCGSAAGTALSDELRLYPFLGMVTGVCLSLARVPRPLPLEWLNHGLIPLDTALYLAAVGSQLTFQSPRPWLRACAAMSAIKFLFAPAVAWGLLTAFNLQGLPRLIVLLEASTPVAVSPLVLPMLFGLDRKLANALWLVTTCLALPWLLLAIPVLQRL